MAAAVSPRTPGARAALHHRRQLWQRRVWEHSGVSFLGMSRRSRLKRHPAKAAAAAAVSLLSLLSLHLHVRHGGAALLVLSATTGRVVDIDGRSVQRSMSLYKFYYYNRLVL